MFDSGQNTDKKYLERWANAYSLTLTIPDDQRFEMSSWATKNTETECGTSACVAGHAALHPWFRRRGLTPHFDDLDSMGLIPQYVFGFWGEDETPFSPVKCEQLLGPVRLTPKRVARVIKKYMLHYWPKEKVKAAIANAVVTYDAKWVHKYTPWNNA